MAIHKAYLMLSTGERALVDDTHAVMFRRAGELGVPLQNTDEAERAAENLAVFVIESREPDIGPPALEAQDTVAAYLVGAGRQQTPRVTVLVEYGGAQNELLERRVAQTILRHPTGAGHNRRTGAWVVRFDGMTFAEAEAARVRLANKALLPDIATTVWIEGIGQTSLASYLGEPPAPRATGGGG